jgi:glycerol-3-phosphate dehydrogenase subunit B
MKRRVVVIGGGASGTAAAYAAHQAGATVTMINGRAGASSLGSGALDGPTLAALGVSRGAVLSFATALGAWDITEDACRLATNAGLLRESRGRDGSVLDVARFKNAVVAVVDASRPTWDAVGLARAWSGEPWATLRGVRFEPVAVDVLRYAYESLAPDADLAALHDDAGRIAWLLERLQKAPALEGKCAVLLGPWLGTRPGLGARLSTALGKPVGEPLSLPGGPAGLRFDAARDELLTRIGVTRVPGWAVGMSFGGATPAAVRAELESGETVDADGAVLALGGLAAGGIRFAPAKPFTLSLACPAVLALRGSPLSTSGSAYGAPFETFAWSGDRSAAGFERVGVWVDADKRLRAVDGSAIGGLFAAGDTVADAPRTLLDAVLSGLVAGRNAALEHQREAPR